MATSAKSIKATVLTVCVPHWTANADSYGAMVKLVIIIIELFSKIAFSID